MSVSSGSNVLRVDLERKIINHYASVQLEERTDIDLIIETPNSKHTRLDEEEAVMIDSDQLNYSQLRELQRRKAAFDIKRAEGNQLAQSKQKSATGLNAQNDDDMETLDLEKEMLQTKNQETTKTRIHEKQLVSETADSSIDKKDELQLQVPLNSRNDAVYLGTVHMGAPVSQPARVVFDTGSEYLAITSVLCDDQTAGNYHFKKYDPLSGGFVSRDQTHKRCKTMAYDMHKSKSNKILSKASSKLTYGSAKLQGFIWQDYTCIQPMSMDEKYEQADLDKAVKDNKCAYFQFLALYKSQGLGHDSDGILGLSPHKDMKKRKLHYLWSLRENGIIDRAMVSFSITSKEMNQTPYALFGGYNSTQIVGGA